MDLSQIHKIFSENYDHIDGYDISHQARLKSDIDSNNFLYGELPLDTCNEILQIANPKKGLFCDLGSGTGKAVLAMQLLGNFKKSVGIEILPLLHNSAVEVHQNLKKQHPQIADKINFHNNDIFKAKLNHVDFILMNHPFKEDGKTFTKLEDKLLSELKPGCKIATIIRPLENPNFKHIKTKTLNFSWGQSKVNFFEK